MYLYFLANFSSSRRRKSTLSPKQLGKKKKIFQVCQAKEVSNTKKEFRRNLCSPSKVGAIKKVQPSKNGRKKFYFGHSSSGRTMFFPARREKAKVLKTAPGVAFSRNFFIAIKIVCCLKLTNFCLLLLRKPKTIEFSWTHWAK